MANQFEYFPLHYRKLLADTDLMTTEEFGAYVRLLLKAWDERPVGTLPQDDSQLARMARVTLDVWKSMKPVVLARFQPVKQKGERLSQKFMRQIYQQIREQTQERSEAGSHAAKARWAKEKHADALRPQSDRNAIQTGKVKKKYKSARAQGGSGGPAGHNGSDTALAMATRAAHRVKGEL